MNALTTKERAEAAVAYQAVEKLLRAMVRKFNGKFGGDIEDQLSEANEIFITHALPFWRKAGGFYVKEGDRYLPRHGKYKLTTVAHRAVWWKLQKLHEKRVRREERRKGGIGNLAVQEKFRPETLQIELSSDAALVIEKARNTPAKTGHGARGWLGAMLLDIGWSGARILESFREIQEVL